MKKMLLVLTLIPSIGFTPVWGNFNFRSKSSTFQLDEDTNIKLESTINDCKGQIVKKKRSAIAGQDVIFKNGTLDDDGNRTRLTGRLKPDAVKQITLSGSESFKGKGASVIQSLHISGNNNRLEGNLLLNNDIQLFDSNTGVTSAVLRSLSKNINLNEGTITLEEDLKFVEDKKLIGNGTIIGNNRSIVLGSKNSSWDSSIYFDNVNGLELNALLSLSQTLTFSGDNCSINGNGHFLTLAPHGKILVERGSTLHLKNIILHQTANGDLGCFDNSGSIIFQDVTFIQDGEYNFNKGSFKVSGYLDLTGSHTFTFSPVLTCSIMEESAIYLSHGLTFSYDPPSGNKHLLCFANKSSKLNIKDSTLHITKYGMQFMNGTLVAKSMASIVTEQRFNDDGLIADEEGLSLGNGTSTNDCYIYVTPGSFLQLKKGTIIYNNVETQKLQMGNILSSITMCPNTDLILYQPLDLSTGRLQVYDGAGLLNFSGQSIKGTVELVKG
jgi:hypothetical protein